MRAGFVYSVTDRLDVGFGYTSPQWFETWKFHARNEIGLPRDSEPDRLAARDLLVGHRLPTD